MAGFARFVPFVVALLAGCSHDTPPPAASPPAPVAGGDVHPVLAAHTAEFERKVYRVTDGVYVAVGFGLANSILIEGDDCSVVVDVMASVESARAVKAAFDEVSKKPIRALIYTHNHPDHVFGGPGFVPADQPIDVYAHETTSELIDRLVSVLRPIIERRSDRMFGTYLPADGPDRIVNSGIGPFLEGAHGGGTPGLIRPNKTFRDQLEVTVCGTKLQLVHAPGETDDQIFVWLPERKTLLPGDNVYKAFPNLYTIRGTSYRDVAGWVRSLDRMRALQPEHLVPSHTRPLSGAAEIDGVLTAYRDAIQFVYDQTIRGMNRGLTPDELVQTVKLPPHLASHPYLQELYGTVEWSVRSIFAGTLGWFDGDTATLSPEPPAERAAGYVALAGGPEPMLAAARKAMADGRPRWAAELATHLLRVEPSSAPAKRVKADALRALGHASVSPNGRNFYLTQALELEGKVQVVSKPPTENLRAFIQSIPIRNLIGAMPSFLDAAGAADVDAQLGFRFTDTPETFTLHVRHGVAEFRAEAPPPDAIVLVTEATVWREILSGLRGAPLAFASGAVKVEGGVGQVPQALKLLALFRPNSNG